MNKYLFFPLIGFSIVDCHVSKAFLKTNVRLNQYIDDNRVVIGSRRAGFFSEFFGCLNWLSWAEKNSVILKVHWNRNEHFIGRSQTRFLYGSENKNYWSEFFEVFWEEKKFVDFQKKVLRTYSPSPNDMLFYRPEHNPNIRFDRERICELITRYITVQPDILEVVELFYRKHFLGKRVIALHLRSREKDLDGKQVSPMELISLANDFWSPDTVFFVLTDSKVYLELAKRELHGPVIATNSTRVDNVHSGVHQQNSGKIRVAREALIDALLASRSNLFIFTTSNLAFGALAFNGQLDGISIQYNTKREIERYLYKGIK